MCSDGVSLTALSASAVLQDEILADGKAIFDKDAETAVLQETRRWLDIYFSGEIPTFLPRLSLKGTPFQMAVWEELLAIPYGTTTTYKEIAARVAERLGRKKMSAQAVGQAVGHNPVGIIVPCHRVIGSNGSLTGYAWGLPMKESLLRLESI